MRSWLVVVACACSSSSERPPGDAPDSPDVPALDAAVDAAIDAPPEVVVTEPEPACAGPSPTCTTAPTTLLAVTPPTWVSNMALLGNTLYVGTWDKGIINSTEAVVAGRVTAIDLVSGDSVELVPGAHGYAVWQAYGSVYFAENASAGTIWRVAGGGDPIALVTNRPHPYLVSADATHVYWSELATGSTFDYVIKRRLLGGGSVEDVMPCDSAFSLAVDDTYVYCADFDHNIWRAAKDGTGLTTIASSTYGYTSMTLCDDSLYATDIGDKTIAGVPLPDGPGAAFVTMEGTGRLVGITATAQHFYATTSSLGVYRVDRSTKDYDLLVPDESSETNPVVWSGQLFYFSRDLGIRRCVD